MKIFAKTTKISRTRQTHEPIGNPSTFKGFARPKGLVHPFHDLASRIQHIMVKESRDLSENTPTYGEINVGQLLVLHIQFPPEWYNQMLHENPRPWLILSYDLPHIFEKHQYYISAQSDQNKFVAFFGQNSVADVNQLFQIVSIINKYYQEWMRTLGNLPIPGWIVTIDSINTLMSKQARNFLNTNPLNTNDFIMLTPIWEIDPSLQYAQNAFYLQKSLATLLNESYQHQLIRQMGNYYLTTAQAIINEDFKW